MPNAFDVYLDGSAPKYRRRIPGPLTSISHLGNIPAQSVEPISSSYPRNVQGGPGTDEPQGQDGYTAAVELRIDDSTNPIPLLPHTTLHFDTPALDIHVQYPLGHMGGACLIGGSGCTMLPQNIPSLVQRQLWSGIGGGAQYRASYGRGVPSRILAWIHALDVADGGGLPSAYDDGWLVNAPELDEDLTLPNGAFNTDSYWAAPSFAAESDSPDYNMGRLDWNHGADGDPDFAIEVRGALLDADGSANTLISLVGSDARGSIEFDLLGSNAMTLSVSNSTGSTVQIGRLVLRVLSRERVF